jgi:O-antigen/teichoic acid export membrane protein
MNIKINFIYNTILTLSQYIVALIVFPYVSRVLGVSNIGVVSFVENTVNYFILFSTMGIGILGVREIAKAKGNKAELDKVFSNLFILSVILTSIVLCIYLIIITYFSKFNIYKGLFYIGSAKVIFTVFLIEWFYKGIENFKFIAIRNVIANLLYIGAIFIFIKDENDYWIFLLITVLLACVNSAVNFLYSKSVVSLNFKEINVFIFLKPALNLGSYMILTSMYTTFNVMYLGIVSNSIEVGFYWVALKIYSICLGFYSAFTTVMMPKMSLLASQEKDIEFNEIINKSFNFLFSVSVPIIVLCIIMAPQIIEILSGNGYEGAVIPMQIIMPLLVVVGIAQVLAIQIFMPKQKDKIILKSSIIGAAVSILLNFILVEKLGSIGTSLVLLSSEVSVTVYYLYQAKKIPYIYIPWNTLVKNLMIGFVYFIIHRLVFSLTENKIVIILSTCFISSFFFIFSQVKLLKSHIYINLLNDVRYTLKKKFHIRKETYNIKY